MNQSSAQTFPRRTADRTIMLRPYATPLPMSFLALALASIGFSGVELRWVSADQAGVAALVALLVTVPLQGAAGLIGFLTRDPVAATGCTLLAGSWAVIGTVTLEEPVGSRSPGLGLFLVAATLTLVVPVVAAWQKPAAAAVMGGSAVRFLLTGIYQLHGGGGWRTTAAIAGLALAATAIYAALAFELEGLRGHAVLPLGRTGASRDAVSHGAEGGSRRITTEPGVRGQL